MADVEEYFPRGGKKPVVQQFRQTTNFLGAPEKAEKKKKRTKKKAEGDDGYLSDEVSGGDLDKSLKNCGIGLSYKTIKPGVTVLARVRQVLETKLTVMLPCRLMGVVMACHISEQYNKLLEAYVNDETAKICELPEMFKPGQYVATKVLEVKDRNVMLTMMPQHINSGRLHSELLNGTILQASVSSVEDHGYVMDLGVPNTTAFLPKSNANADVELETGMLTWVAVKSVNKSETSSVVTLSSDLATLQSCVLKKSNLQALLPGTTLEFIVDKSLDNGIEGHVLKDTTAYIQRQHADTVKGKKPALGQKIRTRVLYVMPTRNTPFLTMKNIFEATYPDLVEEQKLKEGDVVEEAQVIKITGRSIHLKLTDGCMGLLSMRRVQVDEDLTDEQVLAKFYPIGSTHKVRILLYNLSDYIYSVSDQPDILNEKYFSVHQMTVGDIVTATVKDVSDNRIGLAVGRVNGLVPHGHITDAGIVVDPKKPTASKITKKFKVGQEVKARVLQIDLNKQHLVLTLKPSLLSPELRVLKSYEEAEVGTQYTGVIKHIKNYLLVSFFNNVTAFIPSQFVSKEKMDTLVGAFHVGQIVTCTIVNVNPDTMKLTGSLITEPFDSSKKWVCLSKRKHKDAEEVPNKKQKSESESDAEIKEKKKNKNKLEIPTETEIEPQKKKDKKSKADVEQGQIDKVSEKKRDKKQESEESDAIETDIGEHNVLTPHEQGLVDLSDCVTAKNYKKRVVSLLKLIKNKTHRIDRINNKINTIEIKGLNAKNKKFHTAMHLEKLELEERIKKFLETLAVAQNKLKKFSVDELQMGVFQKEKEEKKKQKELKKQEKELKKEQNKNKKVKNQIKKEESQEESSDSEDSEIETQNSKKQKVEKTEEKPKIKAKDIKIVESLQPALEVPSAKEFWSTNTEDLAKKVQEESSSSDEEETEQPKKKRKKLTVSEKLSKARQEEQRLRELELAVNDDQPRSSEQFERALLASPSASQLWIAYMAFHLQATEIEKARAVGRKALQTIPFREEDERLNVWLALLNCEHRFGTKETQQKTLEDALQTNDTYKIHSKLLDILLETGKHQELSGLVDLLLRKYKRDPAMYLACGNVCYKAGLVDKARHVMQKAIAVLEKKEHVSIIVQFALMERNIGELERAEALFEQIVAVYPARVDIAGVYVDMLAKHRDYDRARQVLERMTSQKLPARKMKVLYKKWIEMEEKCGDKDRVEKIRQQALEFIDKAKF